MSDKQYLRWLASDYRVSRREFLGRASALGASALLVNSLAASGSFAGERPQRGGHLLLGLDGSSSTDSLDPLTYVVTWQYTLGYQWANGLVELTEDGSVIPELAESWESNSSATRWVFKLRKDVYFHNGKEFTAEDVLYSLNLHRGDQSSSPAKPFFDEVEDIRATGKHEFELILSAPNADAPYIFADYHILMMPADGDLRSGIGTGGYIIESFQPGVKATATRNPNYWKEGCAFVDSIETIGINDVSARMNALQSGGVHYINRVDPKVAPLLQRDERLQLVDVPSAGFYNFSMRVDVPPFDDVNVRLALKYAIDRKKLISLVLGGFGVEGNDHPISPLDRFYTHDLPQREYDPDKARFHYEKSDRSGIIELKISEATFPGAIDAATLFQADAAAAGIDIRVDRVPSDGYWSDTWLQAPFYGSYWAGRPTADLILNLSLHSIAEWNESRWQSEAFDKLLLEARGELDFDKRKAMYHDLQRMVSDEAGVILPVFNNYLFGSAGNVAGLRPTPIFVGYRIGEQLYFT